MPNPLDDVSVDVLSEIRRFLNRHAAAGYVVGGFVRDHLLGRSSKDLDVVVGGVKPEHLALYLHKHLGFSHPVRFPRFKTALTAGRGLDIEICALQGDTAEDASQRDFTLNCLYAGLDARVETGRDLAVLDPTGRGLADLHLGVLRTPEDPPLTLWLDPLRILRALRLGATRGFRLDAALRESMPRLVYLLNRVAIERVRGELELILLSKRVITTFRLMQTLGVCDIVLPELGRTSGFDQATPYHAFDLFTHTLKATAATPPNLVLRLAALLHDLGKPHTQSMKGRRAVYYHHEEASARLAEQVMLRLRFPKRITKTVVFLIRHHMIHYSRAWSDRAVRRFVRKMGPYLESMLDLAAADQKAQVPGPRRDLPAGDLRGRIAALKEKGGIHLESPVSGHEIMEILAIPEGPLVGEAKRFLMEKAAGRDRAMTREEAAELLRNWNHRT